jgi:hypothetical protein
VNHAVSYKKTSAFGGDRAKVIPITIGKAKMDFFLKYRGKTCFGLRLTTGNQRWNCKFATPDVQPPRYTDPGVQASSHAGATGPFA